MDTLVILMMAFGLFAIIMFILFYVYAKKYYNEKHLTDEYKEDDVIEELKVNDEEINVGISEISDDMEFVPIKKK